MRKGKLKHDGWLRRIHPAVELFPVRVELGAARLIISVVKGYQGNCTLIHGLFCREQVSVPLPALNKHCY